jgi:cytochrome c-type biogenesis protein
VTARAGAIGAEQASAGRRVGLAVRSRAVLATALFVLGFTVVFVAQSVAVVGLSRALLANSETLMRVGGAVTVVMGLVMLGLIRPLQNERRLHVRPTGRILGAPLLGAVFAFGWTVCLGPTLVGVLSLANATDWGGSAWRGLSLVIFYCAGLGIPFLLLAFGFGWATGAMGFLRRHTRTIQLIGAISLIVLGLLMLTGLWGTFIAWLQGRIAGVGTVL